jgi:hypothetical protein
MNLKTAPRYFAKALVAILLLLAACSKDSSSPSVDTTNGEKASESDAALQDAVSTANDGQDGSLDGVSGARVQTCGTVTVDKTAKTITIDFGSDGCAGADGRVRKGKIVIVYIGSDIKTSSSRSITFTNYSVNSNTISSGTITQTNVQHPTATSLSFSLTATSLSLTLSDGKTYTINSYQRDFSYDYGDVTTVADDVATITGSSALTNSSGSSITVDITSPITIKGSCAATGFFYPVSGTYQMVDGKTTYTIDWGTGTCDKDISITVLSKTVVKTLP